MALTLARTKYNLNVFSGLFAHFSGTKKNVASYRPGPYIKPGSPGFTSLYIRSISHPPIILMMSMSEKNRLPVRNVCPDFWLIYIYFLKVKNLVMLFFLNMVIKLSCGILWILLLNSPKSKLRQLWLLSLLSNNILPRSCNNQLQKLLQIVLSNKNRFSQFTTKNSKVKIGTNSLVLNYT